MGWPNTFATMPGGDVPASDLDDNFRAAVLFSSVKIKQQVFTASGTYTPTANMIYCDVKLVGGGGAGGGTSAAGHSTGGGGGAESRFGIFSASDVGSSQTITIGAGGSGVSGAAGNDGSDSSFGSLMTAKGGKGADAVGDGGAGGNGGSGGDYPINGQNGENGATPISNVQLSGAGGSSALGMGGTAVKGSTNASGNSGVGYGAGGSGAISSGTAVTGGSGLPGICIVTEFIAASS